MSDTWFRIFVENRIRLQKALEKQMHDLIFCRDGILREAHSVYNRATKQHSAVLVPVEAAHGANLLSLLGSSIELADGLTVRELFENLAPFGEQISQIAGMDFAAFLAEARLPSNPRTPDMPEFEAIEIFCIGSIDSVSSYETEPDVFSAFERIPGTRDYRLLQPRPVVSDRIAIGIYWDALGIYKTPIIDASDGSEIRSVSMDYVPINEWSALPIRLASDGMVRDRTTGSDFLTYQNGLFTPDSPFVTTDFDADGRVFSRSANIEPANPTLFNTILNGFLREIGFHSTPAKRDEKCREIQDFVDGIEFDTPPEDPEELAAVERLIQAEMEEKNLEREAKYREHPYSETDAQFLEWASGLESHKPGSVLYPDD